jgi:hypothetical protein
MKFRMGRIGSKNIMKRFDVKIKHREAMNRSDVKLKISKRMKEIQNRPEIRAKYKELLSNPDYVNRHKKAVKEAMSRPEIKAKISGPNSAHYRDGKGNEKYSKNFNLLLKFQIRTRDDFMCQWPGCGFLENGKALSVHHIDHNRFHNHPFNLISLCQRHNCREVYMNLDESIVMFQDIQRMRGIEE